MTLMMQGFGRLGSAARAALLVAATWGVSFTAAQAASVRVGIVLPLTGGSADFGNSARYGAELAAQEINEIGGYMGRPLELVIKDDQSKPAEGRRIAESFVRGPEAVEFTVGYCNSGVALNSIEVYQQAQKILMVPCATGTAITHKIPPAQSYIFHLSPSDAVSVKFLVREIVERRKITQIAVLADSTGYGDGGLKDAMQELGERRLQPVYVGRFPTGITTLTQQMQSAKDAGAKALLVFTVGPEHAVAMKSRQELRWNVPYFAPWTASYRSVLQGAGAQATENTFMVQSIVDDTANDRRAGFLARYYAHTKGKDRPIGSLMAAAQTYDAVHLMLRAMFASRGDTSGPALKKALESPEHAYSGVVTTYDHPFSATDHDAYSINMIWLATWVRGELRFAHPEDARLSAVTRRK